MAAQGAFEHATSASGEARVGSDEHAEHNEHSANDDSRCAHGKNDIPTEDPRVNADASESHVDVRLNAGDGRGAAPVAALQADTDAHDDRGHLSKRLKLFTGDVVSDGEGHANGAGGASGGGVGGGVGGSFAGGGGHTSGAGGVNGGGASGGGGGGGSSAAAAAAGGGKGTVASSGVASSPDGMTWDHASLDVSHIHHLDSIMRAVIDTMDRIPRLAARSVSRMLLSELAVSGVDHQHVLNRAGK